MCVQVHLKILPPHTGCLFLLWIQVKNRISSLGSRRLSYVINELPICVCPFHFGSDRWNTSEMHDGMKKITMNMMNTIATCECLYYFDIGTCYVSQWGNLARDSCPDLREITGEYDADRCGREEARAAPMCSRVVTLQCHNCVSTQDKMLLYKISLTQCVIIGLLIHDNLARGRNCSLSGTMQYEDNIDGPPCWLWKILIIFFSPMLGETLEQAEHFLRSGNS